MKRIAFLLIVIAPCVGCMTGHRSINSLAIMELGHKTEPKLVYLPNDYGFMIYWSDNEKPELYLYDKPANTIKMTSDFSEFLSNLQCLPNNVKVDRIRGCAITAIGMPKEYEMRLNQIIKAKGLHLTDKRDGNFGVCSCGATYVRRFKTANK